MNCMALECEGRIVVIDCGVLFDGRGLGVDVIHADFEYLVERADQIEALVLTHGHEDHIGAVSYFLREFDVPVYGPEYALELVRTRIAEHPWHKSSRLDLRVLENRPLAIGPFTIERWQVTHSMPECFGLLIDTPQGLIVHTGDFKIDDRPPANDRFEWDKLERAKRRGVRLMLSDSTNALTEGHSGGERDVKDTLEDRVRLAEHRVVVGLFASNLHRMRALLDVARATGRKVALFGRAIDTHVRIAVSLGLLPDPADVVVPRESVRDIPRRQLLVLATGSQGEAPAALPRLANGTHPDLELAAGDRVLLSSRIIPGNEKPILDLIETLERRGIPVEHRGNTPGIHVSGHAHRAEQSSLIETVMPESFLPVHGTFVHLRAHADLAIAAGVKNVVRALDGDVLVLDEQGLRLDAHVWSGRIFVDRGGEPVDARVLNDRRALAEWGLIVVSATLDGRGQLVGRPHLVTKGVIVEGEDRDLIEDCRDAVARELSRLKSPQLRGDDDQVVEAMRRAVRRFFSAELGKKPITEALVHRLS